MLNFFRKLFTFHLSDIVGIVVGSVFIVYCSDMELFYLVASPQLYFLIFLAMLLFHSYTWLFIYHGESAYTKQMFVHIIRDFFRISLSCVSMIGIYFLIRTFF